MIITRKEKFNNKGFAAVFPTTNEQIDTEEWYVDAGAFFHHIQTAAKEHIKVENNTSVPVEQMDSLSVELDISLHLMMIFSRKVIFCK